MTVTAIPVVHGVWEAFAYRVQTRDRTIVISGDARPSADLAKACQKCDLLIFEVYTMGSTEKVTPAVAGVSTRVPHVHEGTR